MKTRKIGLQPAEPGWYAHWWRDSPVAEVNAKGKTKAKPDAEFWFEHFWKPREFAIWIYELARRLPNTKIKPPELSASDRDILCILPPYPKLSAEQRAALVFIITRVLDPKLINEENSALYNTTARAHLPKWRRGQPHLLKDWRQVEEMDKPEVTPTIGEEHDDARAKQKETRLTKRREERERAKKDDERAKQKETRLTKRREARERAKKFLPLVLSVWKLMAKIPGQNKLIIPLLRSPDEHDLAGVIISDAELVTALKRAKKLR
jgi:hypothetical protein